jgi:hypothetical protein
MKIAKHIKNKMDPTNTTQDSRYLALDLATAQKIDATNSRLSSSIKKKPTLTEILIGTPEQIEAKQKKFAAYSKEHPFRWLGRSLAEPGYLLRDAIYTKGNITSKICSIGTGFITEASKTIVYSEVLHSFTTKLAQYLA